MTATPPVDPRVDPSSDPAGSPLPPTELLPSGAVGGRDDDATGFAATELFDPTTAPVPGPGPAASPAPAAAPAAQDMGNGLPVGTRLNEFEITALVGEGGFGIVYLAIDHSLGRRVALKEYMPSALAGRNANSQVQVKSDRHRETFQAGLKSFVNEARLLASFDHPALVKVYRFWEANGTAYMVMPFLEGKTLRDLLRENRAAGRPVPDEAWLRSVLGPLTEALLVIHGEQCYHRDIAPDNVMQLPNGRWLLLDFGAARRVIGDMTQALTVILKPGYAPIEQYAEVPGMKQGAWTDVYALAAVVYFAITGRTPPPSVGRMLTDTYQPLAQVASGRYGAEFLAAVDRALAVRPEARTQTIEQFRRELGLGEAAVDAYSTQPPRVQPVTPAERPLVAPTAAIDASRRHPPSPPTSMPPEAKSGAGKLIGAAVGVVVIAAVGFGVFRAMAPAPTSPARAAAPAVAAVPAPADATAAAPAPATPAAAPAPPPFDLPREVERVVDKQTSGFTVTASAQKTTLTIGRDQFRFGVTSERDGFVYLLGLGPDGTLAQLVPNTISGPAVRIRKGQPWRFPTGDRFYLATQEPPGPTKLLVIVSETQRDFSHLELQAADPIKLFPGKELLAKFATEQVQAAAIGATEPAPLLVGKARCPDTGACRDAYGAALLRFDTVRP